MATVNYVRNRTLCCGTAAHFGKVTPYEILFGRKPNISNVRIFGSTVYVKRPPTEKGKNFDSKALVGFFRVRSW